ncbi:glycosyltransferase family 2 protein [Victivallales bacterium CCUG 44730]|nr:glycosyltransferase family 2 protein [Victivallales bacterium CCUG 44730]
MISVVIPTYNTALLIGRAIRSALMQTGDFEREIIVVDDCSTDETLKAVEAVSDAGIRIFHQESNRGPAAARNRGMMEARGEFIAFLDGDDYWEPEFLQKTATFLTTHPEAVAVSVMQRHIIPGKAEAVAPCWDGDDCPRLLENFFDFWARYNHVCTGAVLMRTEVARRTGGQREDLRICEDLEFWAMLATCGPWGFIPEILFTSDGGVVTRKTGWLAKNRQRWASAVPLVEWERRLKTRIPAGLLPGYQKVCGRIARNLSYSLLLSGRIEMARREVLQYGDAFPPHRLNRVWRMAARNAFLWRVWCNFLTRREKQR